MEVWNTTQVDIPDAAECFEMWRGGGGHLPLSHMHTPTQIFQNALCIILWHKQSSQCLVCL